MLAKQALHAGAAAGRPGARGGGRQHTAVQRCSSNNSQAVCIELPSKQPACTTQAWEVCEMPPA